MSGLPGFHPKLPRSGMHSHLMDAMRDDHGKTPLHRVHWHDTKPAALRRREWLAERQRWNEVWSQGVPA